MKKERLLLTARHLQFNRNDSLEKQLNNLELLLVIDYFICIPSLDSQINATFI